MSSKEAVPKFQRGGNGAQKSPETMQGGPGGAPGRPKVATVKNEAEIVISNTVEIR